MRTIDDGNQQEQTTSYALRVELKPDMGSDTLLTALRTLQERGGIETFTPPSESETEVAGKPMFIIRGERLVSPAAHKEFVEIIQAMRHWLGNVYTVGVPD